MKYAFERIVSASQKSYNYSFVLVKKNKLSTLPACSRKFCLVSVCLFSIEKAAQSDHTEEQQLSFESDEPPEKAKESFENIFVLEESR